jgi:hypothetical protein
MTMQPLFLVPDVQFDKTAGGETMLSDDPNQWPTEVMQEVYKQCPFVADFEPQVTMDKVDGERGFGFGHIEVQNKTEIQHGADPAGVQAAGIQKVRVPVIIKDKKLQPLDLMVAGEDKLLPLTENRLRQTIFRPQAFDITGRGPGDMSLIGQLYPPYRQNYGFGGGGATMNVGMGKEGSALEQYLEEAAEKVAVSSVAVAKAVAHAKATPARLEKFREAVHKLDAKHLAKAGLSESSTWADHQAAVKASDANTTKRVLSRAAADVAAKQRIAQSKLGSVLAAILPTISSKDYDAFFDKMAGDTGLQRQYVSNGHATGASLKTLGDYTPLEVAKLAAAATLDGITPNVMQLQKMDEGYLLKTASHSCWLPKEQLLNRGDAYRLLGAKVVLAADETGSATMSTGQPVSEPESPEEDQPKPIEAFGVYKVQDEKGRHLVGYVFPNLIDIDGTSLPIALFTNGSQYAVQSDIAGIHAGHGGSIFEGTPKGTGCFYHVLSNGKAEALIPMTVQGTVNDQENGVVLHCLTYDGREVQVVVQPNIQKVTPGEEHLLIPDSFSWLPLDKAEDTTLCEKPEEFSKEAMARRSMAMVTLRGGGGAYSVSGFPVEKLASDEKSFLSVDETLFLLAGLGADMAYAQQKIGYVEAGFGSAEVRVAHHISPVWAQAQSATAKLAARMEPRTKLANSLRKDLVKEAAVIPDPTAVDTVLSLGFLNAENLGIFISYLPKIDEAQEKICELLLASRLGLKNIPVPALEKAMRTVEEVLDGLHQLAFTAS